MEKEILLNLKRGLAYFQVEKFQFTIRYTLGKTNVVVRDGEAMGTVNLNNKLTWAKNYAKILKLCKTLESESQRLEAAYEEAEQEYRKRPYYLGGMDIVDILLGERSKDFPEELFQSGEIVLGEEAYVYDEVLFLDVHSSSGLSEQFEFFGAVTRTKVTAQSRIWIGRRHLPVCLLYCPIEVKSTLLVLTASVDFNGTTTQFIHRTLLALAEAKGWVVRHTKTVTTIVLPPKYFELVKNGGGREIQTGHSPDILRTYEGLYLLREPEQ